MLVRKKSKREVMKSVFNGKAIMASLMGAIFMVFAGGVGASENLSMILIGTAFFTGASGMLLWAGEVSRKLYR
ncbi:MAG: hypothetical protein P8P98_05255 [Emcibacteraceae bacterium]|nr:hypothetical protein [Emcibacteraceae bacterium]MDG1994992.1 hypothetical protein [Emcibacteraceae bacterium]